MIFYVYYWVFKLSLPDEKEKQGPLSKHHIKKGHIILVSSVHRSKCDNFMMKDIDCKEQRLKYRIICLLHKGNQNAYAYLLIYRKHTESIIGLYRY